MRFDEILVIAVIVMLIASTYMGYCVQRTLYHSKMALEVLAEENSKMTLAALDLGQEVARLKHRVAELDK